MEFLTEGVKFFIYSFAIVIISKYMLVTVLRKLSELLNLGAKATGNIAGIATSIPELLTVSFSASAGFIDTSIYNVLSSNIVNLVQYLSSIYLNNTQKYLSNKAIKIDIFMVIVTILLPVGIAIYKINLNIVAVFIFTFLAVLFFYININVHKLYLKEQDKKILEKENIEYIKEINKINKKKKLIKIIINIIFLILITLSLYLLGNLLSTTLTDFSLRFDLPEILLGIALGIITSIPELITFIEAQKKQEEYKVNKELGVVEATNNLLTSNILNIFVIQSIGIVIYNVFI